MARYIDADKFLKDQIRRCGCVPLIGSCTMDNESLKDIIERTPTADVEEVKHGYWIDKDDECGKVFCSVCGAQERPSDSKYKSPRCPLCGAIMSGGNK